ncbi:MAG: oxidoreductase [Actinomycetota bacterium]|nr:oxidoreductase [Actinomycetota bacterium]
MAKKWTASDIPDQSGRTVLITGANSGLGLESAIALAAKGATVLLACRNPERGERARTAVAAVATGEQPRVVALDVSDLDHVAEVGRAVAEELPRLDVLMNNAGVMAIPLGRTKQGHELQFATNHLGHFALTGHLLPTLLRAPSPRVITVSSTAHRPGSIAFSDLQWERRRYQPWRAYSQSKLANLLFSKELQRQATEHATALLAASAHPGYAATNLTAAGPASRNRLLRPVMPVADRVFGQSAVMGALPQLYAATMPEVAGDDYWGPGGLAEQRGYPARVGRTAAAKRADDARHLWTVSEELTGVTYAWS